MSSITKDLESQQQFSHKQRKILFIYIFLIFFSLTLLFLAFSTLARIPADNLDTTNCYQYYNNFNNTCDKFVLFKKCYAH